MRELTFTETHHISGGLGHLAVFGGFLALEALGCTTIGPKRTLMAPISLTVGFSATVLTSLLCIPVGFSQSKDFSEAISKTFNYWKAGPRVGFALQNLAS